MVVMRITCPKCRRSWSRSGDDTAMGHPVCWDCDPPAREPEALWVPVLLVVATWVFAAACYFFKPWSWAG